MLRIMMRTRRSTLLIGLLVVVLSCNNQSDQVPGDVVNIPNTASGEVAGDQLPVLTFKETTHDFGKLFQGEVVSYGFRFRNTGKSDLVIANVSASCGCTATQYPKMPIKPGDEEIIQVTFDSGGRTGFQHKTVTIAANTQPNTTVINIKAQVIIPGKD
jgi:hypothetical protein